ncbi:hypothetical protein D3C87_1598120 [compost metagenome]
MQPRHVFRRAPVATVQRVAARQVQGHRHGFAITFGQHQHEGVRLFAMRAFEEIAVQIRRVAMLEVRAAIAVVKEAEFSGADLGAA